MADNHTNNSYYFYRIVNKDNPEDYVDIDADDLFLFDYVIDNYPNVKAKSYAGAVYLFNSHAASNKELLQRICERYKRIKGDYPVSDKDSSFSYISNAYCVKLLVRDNCTGRKALKLANYGSYKATSYHAELTTSEYNKNDFYIPIVFSEDLDIFTKIFKDFDIDKLRKLIAGDSSDVAKILLVLDQLSDKNNDFCKNFFEYFRQLLIQDEAKYFLDESNDIDTYVNTKKEEETKEISNVSDYLNSRLIITNHSSDSFYLTLLSTFCYHIRIFVATGKKYVPLESDINDTFLKEIMEKAIFLSSSDFNIKDLFTLDDEKQARRANEASIQMGVVYTSDDFGVLQKDPDTTELDYSVLEDIPNECIKESGDFSIEGDIIIEIINDFNIRNDTEYAIEDFYTGNLPEDLIAEINSYFDEKNKGSQRKQP